MKKYSQVFVIGKNERNAKVTCSERVFKAHNNDNDNHVGDNVNFDNRIYDTKY